MISGREPTQVYLFVYLHSNQASTLQVKACHSKCNIGKLVIIRRGLEDMGRMFADVTNRIRETGSSKVEHSPVARLVPLKFANKSNGSPSYC